MAAVIEKLLTTEEVARALRLEGYKHPVKAVQRLVREGNLAGIRIGRHYLVRLGELERFLERNKCKQYMTLADFD